jgi:hypothetical protein
MGALVNVFKSIFGGILGFFGGLFGGKKDADGFYMAATDDQLEELPAAPAASKGAKAVAMNAAPANAAPAKVSKPAAIMTPEELIAAALAAVAKAPEGTAEAVAAKAASLGFAEKNMIPTLTSGRRLPGPSLSPFKAMAKQINS